MVMRLRGEHSGQAEIRDLEGRGVQLVGLLRAHQKEVWGVHVPMDQPRPMRSAQSCEELTEQPTIAVSTIL